MKLLLWFLIGCMCIGVPFFAGYDQHDLWISVFGGMIGGIMFLILLYSFVVRKEFPIKWKIIIAGIFSFHIIAFASFTMTSYRTSTFQRENLLSIRSYLMSSAIPQSEIYGRSLSTLHRYYDQPVGKKKSFVEVFNTLYGKEISNGVFRIIEPPDFGGTFVMYEGDSIVQLVASNDTIAKGIRNDFMNINGHRGKIQYTARLSKHGVMYERNN